MSEALTKEQATEQFECQQCQVYGDCQLDCVASSTVSIICVKCGSPVYFGGHHYAIPDAFACPYCKHDQKNPWPG